MTLPNPRQRAVAFLLGLLSFTVPGIFGQTPGAGVQNPPSSTAGGKTGEEPPPRRWSIGFRVRTLPVRSFSVMDNGHAMNTTTIAKTVYDTNYNTTSKSFILGGGLAFEAPLSQHLVLSAEVIFNRLRYQKTTDTYWGTDDPTTSNDERSHKNVTEDTKARLFDVPLLLHYGNLRPSGWASHLYLSAGATARNASSVRTTDNITNADGTAANDQIRALIARRTLIGATVGVGFRFIDEFNIKVTPEVRYTRWNGATFNQDSTQSPRNQLEVGIGFTR